MRGSSFSVPGFPGTSLCMGDGRRGRSGSSIFTDQHDNGRKDRLWGQLGDLNPWGLSGNPETGRGIEYLIFSAGSYSNSDIKHKEHGRQGRNSIFPVSGMWVSDYVYVLATLTECGAA